MLNFWLCILTFVISLSSFSLATKISNVNKIFYLLPRSIMENALRLDEVNNEPYYDQSYLEINAKDYFSLNLKYLVSSYHLAFDYFKQNEDDDFFSIYFDGVNIHFKTTIVFNFQYVNSLTFTIKQHE